MTVRSLRIAHLYPDEMNIYGDRGNVVTLARRAEWRGIRVTVSAVERGPVGDLSEYDLVFWGGGQDRDQRLVFEDAAAHKAASLRAAVVAGVVVLAVCGGYQLLGSEYVTVDGRRLPGLGLVDLRTVAGSRRCIGNVLITADRLPLQPPTIVGFENHAGKTYLGPGVRPLGRVVRGFGNNGEDGTEGVVQGTIFGTYVHGSLLPKNPHLADHLLALALARGGGGPLAALDDTVEMAAHAAVRDRLQRRARPLGIARRARAGG